jgi:hypothetical protein
MTDFQKPAGVAFTINADGDYYIGSASQDNVVGRWIVHISDLGSLSATIIVKGRAKGTALAPVAIPYKKRYLNGSVGDDTNVSTTITGVSIIDIDSAGLDIAFTVDWTSGSGSIIAIPQDG